MIRSLFRLDPISLVVTEAPNIATPVDTDILKTHLAVDGDALDDLIGVYLQAATNWAEDSMHRPIMAREYAWRLRCFPHERWHEQEITLPCGKVQAINDITYVRGGSQVVWTGPSSSPVGTAYQEDLSSESGARISPLQHRCWPSVDIEAISPVVVSFRAGWEEVEDVPAPIVQAIMFAVNDMLEVRSVADLATLQIIAANGATFEIRETLLSAYKIRTVY